MKKTLLYYSLFFLPTVSSCHTDYYDVGAAAVSIEPNRETVSLTLAGFASPDEGRFTITWDDLGEYPVTSLSRIADSVLFLNDNYMLSISGKQDLQSGKPLAMNMPVKEIAFFKNDFYGINLKDELVKGARTDQTISWTIIKPAIKLATLTATDDGLYIVNLENKLLKGIPDEDGLRWISDDHMPGIISLTSDAKHSSQPSSAAPESIISLASDTKRLYGLTSHNTLWQKSLSKDEPWGKIGYKNNVTYTIDAIRIAFINNNLYAIDEKKHLYKSRHSTVGDLQATAMSIRKNGRTVVIVGVDVCGFDKSFTDLIKEEVYQKRGIAGEAILINASHSHFAPVTQSWITWQPPNQKPDSLYLLQVVRTGIIKAIEESLDNAQPSRLYLQRGSCDIGKNRTRIEGYTIYDNTVDVITAVSVKDQKKCILYLAGCHPVFTEPEVGHFTINANFPGFSRKLLADDPDIEHAIFLQAFAGDINPKDPFRKSGEQLADSVLQIMNRATRHEIRGDLSFFMDTIAIAITPPTLSEIESFKAANLPKQGEMVANRDIRWADVMLEHHRKNRMPDEMPVYYQTLNVGNWKLIALSREVTTEFGIVIRDLWPDRHVSAIAYTNDVPSYLATDPHIRAKNYEGYGSFFWYAQPKPFPLKSFEKVIDKIKHINH
ncbi:MAG: hypothetical protein LBG96_00505 [Tannerella sp.]|jgi:hypothetical protein|nr:hypothetical protein [Tannerella sp.]